jgi:hypothetical protein
MSESKNSNPVNSLQDALKTGARFTRKRAFKFWIQTILFIRGKRRKYFYLMHLYLRWVDDFLDNPENSNLSKKEFVDNQLNLIDTLWKEESKETMTQLKCTEEFFLYYFIKYCLQVKNYNLVNDARKIVEILGRDVNRLNNNGLFSNDELNRYLIDMGLPVFITIYYFLQPYDKTQKKITQSFIGYVLLLRDFFEDLEAGYLNIGSDDIRKYNLDISDMRNDKKRFDWLRDKYPEYVQLMYDEIYALKSMPLKVKLFWFPAYPFFLTELYRIKVYDYRFGEKPKKNLSKELKVYSQSLIFIPKIFFIIFF